MFYAWLGDGSPCQPQNENKMETQNPITGRAKKKLGNVYSRTLYGKNILQTCPPSTKGHQTPNQLAAQSAFAVVQRLSTQISASLLNSIYYQAPNGRSRRSQWQKELSAGNQKTDGRWQYDPSAIIRLGSNPVVSEEAFCFTPASTEVIIPKSSLSAVNQAIISEIPCLILICPSKMVCISLFDFTSLQGNNIVLQNISTSLINEVCWIFPLWLVNMGTEQHPLLNYGSFEKIGL